MLLGTIKCREQDSSDSFIDNLVEKVPADVENSDLQILRQILQRHGYAWSKHDLDLGRTELRRHHIRLTSDVTFKERSRRIPHSMVEAVRQHLEEMLEQGVIRKSESSYSSGVVLVRKKDGRLRFCIDLRRLNNLTIKDAYALPHIEEMLDALNGAQCFSKLDLQSGYWQVAEEDKSKTAFQWEIWVSLSATECPWAFQMLQPHSNVSWRPVWEMLTSRHASCSLTSWYSAKLSKLTLRDLTWSLESWSRRD